MDFSRFKIHDWLMVGGGAAMLVLGFFLDWTSVSGDDFRVSGDGPFDYFFTGGIAWLLVVAAGVLAFLRAGGILPDDRPWALIFVAATGLATFLLIVRILLGAGVEVAPLIDDLVDVKRGIGMWGALVWSLVAFAGAVMGFQAEGGNLSDLTDVQKLKDSFAADRDDDVPPPPPPPAPPPPPSGP